MTELISIPAKIYANSLIQLNLNQDIALDNLYKIKNLLEESSDLKTLMQNPTISPLKKYEIFEDIFKNELDEKIKSFIKILIEKNRFDILEQIITAYKNEADRINNNQKVEIISAIELTDEYKKEIVKKLEYKLKKNIIPQWIIDEEIIGGLVIKIEDDIIDNSIKNKLDKINKI